MPLNSPYDDATLVPAAWPVPWGRGQPEAVVLSCGREAFVIHPARRSGDWAVLRFEDCESIRYGGPNLEVADAHPLGGRAKPGALYVVEGSPWRAELEAINATHAQYAPAYWRDQKHYFCFLWDRTFECLARSLSGETLTADLRGAIDHAAQRIHTTR